MAIPSIPQNLYVQQGNAEVFLSWDISAGATSYGVQRSTDGVSFSTIATVSVNNYLDSAVTVGSQYYYQVASINSSGTSPYTANQSVVPTLTAELSLGQIRLMSQQRADRVNSQFVTLPEWNTYINQSYFELYDLLVTVYEDYFMASPLSITTDGINFLYALPDGSNNSGAAPFYKLLGVDCGLGAAANAWVTLKKFDFIGRNRYIYPQITSTYLGVFNLRYRLMGSNIEFIPTPSAGQILRLWYIPRVSQLLKDTDVMDGVSGWTEYVIVDAAIKALQKEESDVSVLMAQKMALTQRIQDSAMNRDAGQPDTISNTRLNSERWGGYDTGGGGPWGGL